MAALNFNYTAAHREEAYTVCPECGRVYSNADLVAAASGTPAPAAGQYDTRDSEFIAALAIYNRAAYEAA